jgi:DNA helicase-2/ATP-dependent DNA helicase PcrA
MNPNDSIALMRVINTPPRGVGKTTLDDIERRARDFGVSIWETINLIVEQNLLPARAVSALKSFRDVVNRLAERARDAAGPISEVVKAAVIDTGYERALKDENTEEAEGRLLNLEELVNAAVESEQRGETLRDFLDHAALVSDTDQYKAEAQVTLMTMHAAKGLEFPLVFIAGLEEGLFPHSRANESQNDLEEERRLCYVAITRAEKYLYLSHAMKRRVYGAETPSEPSRFLMEFPLELIEDQSKGASWLRFAGKGSSFEGRESASSFPSSSGGGRPSSPAPVRRTSNYQGQTYNNASSVKEFFARQGRNVDAADFGTRAGSNSAGGESGSGGSTGLKVGTRVRHAKYGVGLIVKREGEGEDAKLTINFPGYGHKKMIEKYAALEKV